MPWVEDPHQPSGYRWVRRGEQPPTTMLPMVPPAEPGRTVRYDDHEDHQLPARANVNELGGGMNFSSEPTGDVGDWIDPNADDPTPDEIVDPGHPDYVEPWTPR